MPSAHADACPDAEVVFARGTTEEPGPGPTGDAFIDSLRSRVGAKTVGVYAVDYPATTDFPTAVDGIADARAHILATAATCPHTKVVLGGFSQGAAVMGFVTASVVPDGVSASDVPAPMPPDVADHVAAVALFGKPSTRFMHRAQRPAGHRRPAVCRQDRRLVRRQRPGLRSARVEFFRTRPVRRDWHGRPGRGVRHQSTPGQLGRGRRGRTPGSYCAVPIGAPCARCSPVTTSAVDAPDTARPGRSGRTGTAGRPSGLTSTGETRVVIHRVKRF